MRRARLPSSGRTSGLIEGVISLDKTVKIVGRVPAEVLAAWKFLQVAVAKYFFVEGLQAWRPLSLQPGGAEGSQAE